MVVTARSRAYLIVLAVAVLLNLLPSGGADVEGLVALPPLRPEFKKIKN